MVFDEAIDLGDRVVLAGRVRGPGHDSDVTVEAPFGGVYELRGGKVVRVQVLGSREEIGSREYPPLLRKICLFTPCELGHQRTVRRMRSGLATSPRAHLARSAEADGVEPSVSEPRKSITQGTRGGS